MRWRKHKTKQEKEIRKNMYKKLREAGCTCHEATVFRDWTSNKIELICKGEAKPLRKW